MHSIIPVTLKVANDLVTKAHRHHKPVRGHRFSLGLVDDEGVLVGAVIVGRPVARGCDPNKIVEVTRLVTDGSKNACSQLYSAAARAAKEMGFESIQTYILEEEMGSSLKASGWKFETLTFGREWKHTSGPRRNDQPNGRKQRWSRQLNDSKPELKTIDHERLFNV